MGIFDGGGSGRSLDIPALLDGVGLAERLGALVSAGALVSLGATRDGGALGVTLTVDGEWVREYFRDVEALSDWMEAALPEVELLVEDARASAEAKKRTRRRRGA